MRKQLGTSLFRDVALAPIAEFDYVPIQSTAKPFVVDVILVETYNRQLPGFNYKTKLHLRQHNIAFRVSSDPAQCFGEVIWKHTSLKVR
jgi:hypothetical protein